MKKNRYISVLTVNIDGEERNSNKNSQFWWPLRIMSPFWLRFRSVQFTQACLTLCDPMDCSTRLPCSSPTPRAYSNSCPSTQWCHPTISRSVVPFSSCLQSSPASGFFPVSQFGWLSIIPWCCILWLYLCVRYTETNVSKNFFVSVLFISFCWFLRVWVCVCVYIQCIGWMFHIE